MARAKIDTDKLRVYFRTLRKDDLLDLLERAVDLLPRTRIAALVEGYVDLDDLKPESLGHRPSSRGRKGIRRGQPAG